MGQLIDSRIAQPRLMDNTVSTSQIGNIASNITRDVGE
jgi:hypothetical protein